MEFLSGNLFKSKCRFVFDETGFSEKFQIKNNFVFVKTDYIREIYERFILKNNLNVNLITHNSDINIDESYRDICDNKCIIKWYAQNVCYNHNKLISIPIGIANERIISNDVTEHFHYGAHNILKSVIDCNLDKTNLVYCNFNPNTNLIERMNCLNKIQKKVHNEPTKLTYKEYLRKIATSYFVISPNGNGVDCHRHWEALYLKTIPIVTKSININFYKKYPFIVLNDWADFEKLKLSVDVYNSFIKNNKYDLLCDNFLI